MSEYEGVQRGSLKLKGTQDGGIKKKKKKKSKDKEKVFEQICSGEGSSTEENPRPKIERRTKAELAFLQHQEKRNSEQILERAAKTHKERIVEFNQHLDSLTEHFDIPKVSWTK